MLPAASRLLATDAVVLDLDGTLHEDPAVHDAYAALLQEGSGLSGLVEEVAAVLDRRHPAARPGDLVDVTRRLAVSVDQEWRPVAARSWDDGASAALPDLPGPVTTTPTLRYLGDRWQVAGAVAAVRGLTPEVGAHAFATARSGAGHAALVAGAAELLPLLRPRGLLLATNTPEHLARPLVQSLGLLDLVDDVRFGADKPTGTPGLVHAACARWATTPDRVAVVGDNMLNDLLPAARLGCPTVHVDPWGTDPDGVWSTVRVAALADLERVLATYLTTYLTSHHMTHEEMIR